MARALAPCARPIWAKSRYIDGLCGMVAVAVLWMWKFDTSVEGPGRRLLPGLLGSAVPDKVRYCPRGPVDFNGTGLTIHPVLDGLDRASSPIAPNPPRHSALRCRPNSNLLPGPIQRSAMFSAREAQQPGGCMRPIYPPRAGFRPGRFSGRKSRADGTGCTFSPVPIGRVPDQG